MRNKSKELKQKSMLDSATELLAIKPTATLQEIADYSNVGIATLHRHFANREALLDELAMHAIQMVEAVFETLPIDSDDIEGSLTRVFDALIPLGNKVSFLGTATYLSDNPEVKQYEKRLEFPMLEAIRNWQDKGVLRGDLSSKWILDVVCNLLFVAWRAIQSGDLARNDASKLLIQTMLNGFATKYNS